MTPVTRGTLAGLGAIGLWSALALLTTATEGIPPFQLLAMGFGVAGLGGVAWRLRGGPDGLAALRQPADAALLATAALFGYHALYFIALKRAPVVEANLVNYLWPLLIVVFAATLGGVPVRPRQWLGTALGLAAAVLLVGRGLGGTGGLAPAHALGYLAALGAALVWSAYSVLNRRFHAVPSRAIAGPCLAVAVLGLGAHLAFEATVMPTGGQWLAIALLGLGPTGLAFWLWDIGTKRGDLAVLGTLSYAAPLFSTALLLAFGRAQGHWTQAVAVALLLAGAWLSIAGARRPPEPAPAGLAGPP